MTNCPECKQETMGSSPTGVWCNNKECQYQDPCPCWQNRIKDCFFHYKQQQLTAKETV
jgi:hypothetical protein